MASDLRQLGHVRYLDSCRASPGAFLVIATLLRARLGFEAPGRISLSPKRATDFSQPDTEPGLGVDLGEAYRR